MRILYAIQGTGNGHMARAHEVVPMLMEYGEVDLLVSGIQTELSLPWPVKYRLYGWGFIFGKQGGIDWAATIRRSRPVNFIKEICNLPVSPPPISLASSKLNNFMHYPVIVSDQQDLGELPFLLV